MEKLSKLRRKIKATIPLVYRKKMGALNPYMVPIYSRLVYYKRLEFCMKAIKKFSRLPKGASFNFADIGCGFGVFMRILGKEYPKSRLVGVDLREENQLQYGYKLVDKKESLFIRGDALNIPLKDEQFDIVLTTDALEHVADPIKGLKEINRILKKNGLLIILVPTELLLFRIIRKILINRKMHADYHWVGSVKNVKQFERELKKQFKVIKKEYIPLPFLKNVLNYDMMYVCKKF